MQRTIINGSLQDRLVHVTPPACKQYLPTSLYIRVLRLCLQPFLAQCCLQGHVEQDVSVVLHAIAPIESNLFILHTHSPVKLFWVRYDIVASVELANFEAVVAKLGEAIPVVCLIL